ncbi:hypothetical protein RR48_05838 [Papilio machaon]|uniref:Uncharacterized protein n=1 Tax=Papilio machaon TaxID=76193 RepID=A0A0N0PB64_PAPMA|nr:hypothetical protein RR48_05838 [Papilio machaon]
MVRSLSQWTKTLSFPARLSPNRTSKESVVNVQPASPGVSPTPSASSLPQGSDKTISPIPITEISQIGCQPDRPASLAGHLGRKVTEEIASVASPPCVGGTEGFSGYAYHPEENPTSLLRPPLGTEYA